jgi:hypothetical protein
MCQGRFPNDARLGPTIGQNRILHVMSGRDAAAEVFCLNRDSGCGCLLAQQFLAETESSGVAMN